MSKNPDLKRGTTRTREETLAEEPPYTSTPEKPAEVPGAPFTPLNDASVEQWSPESKLTGIVEGTVTLVERPEVPRGDIRGFFVRTKEEELRTKHELANPEQRFARRGSLNLSIEPPSPNLNLTAVGAVGHQGAGRPSAKNPGEGFLDKIEVLSPDYTHLLVRSPSKISDPAHDRRSEFDFAPPIESAHVPKTDAHVFHSNLPRSHSAPPPPQSFPQGRVSMLLVYGGRGSMLICVV